MISGHQFQMRRERRSYVFRKIVRRFAKQKAALPTGRADFDADKRFRIADFKLIYFRRGR